MTCIFVDVKDYIEKIWFHSLASLNYCTRSSITLPWFLQNLILITRHHNNDNVCLNVFLFLPEDMTKADFSKCEDKYITYHNLEHTIQ